ncbi:MAG TPA: peptidoglycan-associated lipoprotein Pal [Rhodocyclaceae bacterium]|nr:peptidoglycan-associated lipoprotein Pal [Rhodocyclaceae bacterium]
MSRLSALLTAVSASLLLAACGSQPTGPEQNPAGVENRTPSTVGPTTESVKPETIDQYSLDALKNPKSAVYKRSVYFDYDEYVIKDEFKPLIEAHAKFLIRNPKLKMLIQGNADERGSREYNVALGQKRAEAVKKALILLGAAESQIEAVSLGKEKPRCEDHTEQCWSENRRGDMLYSGAGIGEF